jgi:hypothetical protein
LNKRLERSLGAGFFTSSLVAYSGGQSSDLFVCYTNKYVKSGELKMAAMFRILRVLCRFGGPMSTKVAASDVQKNFGVWHDRALKEPVQITKYGRETVYLVSAETFHELWASYRRAGSTRDLSEGEMVQIDQAQVPAEHDYDYAEDSKPPRR